MVKKMLSLIAVAATVFSASAQNARVDAMGGCEITPDISRILSYPADINKYPDQMQGTVYSGPSFGPVLGVKAIGDMFRVGISIPMLKHSIANIDMTIDPTSGEISYDTTFSGSRSSVLRSDFYGDALDALDNNASLAGQLPDAFPHIPHLLFGVNLDPVTIGLDFFIEMTRYKNEGTSVSGAQKTETTNKAKISNVGGILSADIDLGGFTISPLVGIGTPSVSGLVEVKTDTTIRNEIKKESGIFLTVGGEVGLGVSDFNLIAGFFFTNESYQLNIYNVIQNEMKNRFIDTYLGFTTEVNSLFLVAQYGLGLEIGENIDINDTTGTNYKDKEFTHSFRFGLERPISGVWIFDELIPRAGLTYILLGESSSSENSGGETSESSTNNANSANQAQLTTGIGLAKGIAAVDINVVLGSWDGALTGPSVIEGTLTLNFGKTGGRSSSATSDYKSAPTPVLSTPETETTETESEDKPKSDSDIEFDF